MMRRFLLGILFVFFAAMPAMANVPGACPLPLQFGQILTTAQWNACLAPISGALPTSGGTMTGPLITAPSGTNAAGFNIPQGMAPTTPNNGDIWETSTGLFAQWNGSTLGGVLTSTLSPAKGDVLYYGSTGWVDLGAGTPGFFLETQGPAANPVWAAAPGGTGCTPTGTQFQPLVVGGGGTGCANDTNALLNGGALSLGSSGTLGSVAMGNATSGVVTLQPVAGALGTVTDFLPTGGTLISSTTAIGEVTGTPSSSTFLRGDGTWSSVSATGCTVSGTQFQILVVNSGGNGCSSDSNASVNSGALSLGSSGTVGTIALGNATSGTITLKTVTGALGTVNASLPANSGQIAELNLAQTWSAQQEFSNGDLLLLGSSSGALTLEAPAAASTYVSTLPPNTGTIAELNFGQTWSGAQTFNNNDFRLAGSSSGITTLTAQAVASGDISFPAVTDTVGVLGTADQVMSGGVVLTAFSIGTVSSGATTIDCGKNPVQYLTNGGAFTLAAPSNDGSCIVLVTNNGSAGAITPSGFTQGSNSGDTPDTVNTHKFAWSIFRINGVSHYLVSAYQ